MLNRRAEALSTPACLGAPHVAVSAIEAGATIVDVTVNGVGERAGNVCLDELAVVLNVLYHLELGINTERLTSLAGPMFRLVGIPLPFNKPLVGPHAGKMPAKRGTLIARPINVEGLDSFPVRVLIVV